MPSNPKKESVWKKLLTFWLLEVDALLKEISAESRMPSLRVPTRSKIE